MENGNGKTTKNGNGNGNTMNAVKTAIEKFLNPILMGIVVFFLIGLVNNIDDIEKNQIEMIKTQAEQNAEMRYLKQNDKDCAQALKDLHEMIDKLENKIRN